ncbi:MAG: polyprenyl synthetase family protein [Nitrospiraceae bacterium]|nr:polyprenyl synthetase family protein [Nitrospiraceae bacterium]
MGVSPGELFIIHRSGPDNIMDSFKTDFEQIEQVLNKHFSSHEPFINKVIQYILFAEGKRLRPLLTVCSARLCGKNDKAVYNLSVVPEYLHAASLLHDDVVDGGKMRRGRTPAYKIWGNKAAVLVGDFLFAKAIDLASRFGIINIAKTIAKTVALMSEGEIIQLLQMEAQRFDEATYMEIIYKKTASLISTSCRIGALLAGAEEEKVEALGNYGLYLGQAFQIIDDILDYTAKPNELGKALGTDLAEGTLTLPLVVAIKKASARERERLVQILKGGNPSHEDFIWVSNMLVSTGGTDYARGQAKALISSACEALEVFPGSKTKDSLQELAWFVLDRRK